MKISVCIPFYNESRIIEKSARELSAYMEQHFSDYEILFCNDGSTDSSAKILSELELPKLRIIGYDVNHGKGYAVRTAMLAAEGDLRMFLDTDLAYGTEVIETVVKESEKHPNDDVFIGSRNLGKGGYGDYTWLRKVASKVYMRVISLFGGLRVSDSQCGCKAYTRRGAERIFPLCRVDRFAFDFETLLLAKKFGLGIREFPVKVLYHCNSSVKVGRDSLKMLCDLWKMKKRIKRM